MAEKKTIHMMGICGTAMGSLAGLLQEMGYDVRGSDQNVYPPMSTQLQKLGIKIMEGYRPENLQPRPDRVIVGNVMTRNHSEVQALLQSDIPYTSLPQAMGEYVIGKRHSVVITGTHGKTTTTALAAWVLEKAGLSPGFMIGGVPINFPLSFAMGKGNYFVIEGDEYDTAFFDKVPKFVHYRPRSAILTSVEFDHADIYKDLSAVKEAFVKLLKLIPQDGNLIYCAEDENIKSILSEAACWNLQGYGLREGDWQLRDVRWSPEAAKFDVVLKGKKIDQIETQLFGEYNLLNCLSVYALAYNLKIEPAIVRGAMACFKSVKRRQEIIGKPGGVTVIEDFAHHPTAVRVTIDGVRKRFARGRIIAVFEPRSATSRRKIFQHDFADALAGADAAIVSTPYDQTKIAETDRFDSKVLVSEINSRKPQMKALVGESIDQIVTDIKKIVQPGDVVLLMSNGGFGGIYQKLISALEKQ